MRTLLVLVIAVVVGPGLVLVILGAKGRVDFGDIASLSEYWL